jgi:hypothetical protein
MTVLITVLMILGGSGFITAVLTSHNISEVLPFLVQTSDPEASAMAAEPWQAEQIFILIGFILFNMIGIGVTIGLIMWFLHRGVAESRAVDDVKAELRTAPEAE